ncbi:DUF4157 domain-containing protein [Paucibacter sp. PLA-PC-4]|uniref:eCIS core domain-containing protein n=1 Tax=Paucibacter sp. PLA-PC-4 TaxID=2993655 RepID=UPI002248954D|nr:DUF4157 domain-containing protein [Paucibacter sp. PLA-PC-4]MCX2861265.1 DUF4157 domain-containing protein [Paucibacter sp. PLA-PC-4]
MHGGASSSLPTGLQAGLESLSQMSMDDVRVHYDSSRPAQLRALAYAQGQHIHLAPGQQAQLPHEAWHVVQQKQGRVRANLHSRGVAINDDDQLEREADRMGARALSLGALPIERGARSRSPGGAGGAPLQAKWSLNRDLAELRGEVLYFDADHLLTYDPITQTLDALGGGDPKVLSGEAHAALMRLIHKDVRAEDDDELRRLGFSEEDILALDEQGAANALDLRSDKDAEVEDAPSGKREASSHFSEVRGKVRDKISAQTAKNMHSGKQSGLKRWLRAVKGRDNPDLGILGDAVYVRLDLIKDDDEARECAATVKASLIKDSSGHYYGYVTNV